MRLRTPVCQASSGHRIRTARSIQSKTASAAANDADFSSPTYKCCPRYVQDNDFALFLAAFGRSIGEPDYNAGADLDGDGTVTLVDYQQWLQCYRDFVGNPLALAPTPGMLGDLDADWDVDLDDFAAFQDCNGNPPAMAFPCILKFDFDGSGTIDLGDLAGLVEVFDGP